jgi:Fe-S-cluster containining protein
MDGSIAGAVWRVAALVCPPRVVTPAEYETIACNRCGACCEDIRVPGGPEVVPALIAEPATDEERRWFLAGLRAVGPVAGGWRYRCEHFQRDADGLGVCGIHESRPSVCRWFPGGGVVRTWPQCAWYVEVREGR